MVKANEVTRGSKGKLIKPGDLSWIPGIPMKAEGESKLYNAVLWPPHMDSGMTLPPDITDNDDDDDDDDGNEEEEEHIFSIL